MDTSDRLYNGIVSGIKEDPIYGLALASILWDELGEDKKLILWERWLTEKKDIFLKTQAADELSFRVGIRERGEKYDYAPLLQSIDEKIRI